MYFVKCEYSLVLVLYCVALVLVIVNGQPTTGDNTENDEIAQLRTEMANLKRQLAVLYRNTERGQYSDMTALIGLHLFRLMGEISTARCDRFQ